MRKAQNRSGGILMKKTLLFLLVLIISICGFTACKNNETLLDPNNPVTLTMWHVYGEQADSPMNQQIEEFNQTVGREKGIVINVTNTSSATYIGQKLLDAQANKAGALEMPDLFFCHASNARDLGASNLLDWKDVFSQNELTAYVQDFIADGMVEDSLSVLPVSKSTHLLFVAGGVFDTFAAETGVSYNDLSTWDGLFQVAEKYYAWSGGSPFCAIDYLTRCVELDAISNGATDFYTDDGWYDTSNQILMNSFRRFATSIAKGHIIVSDLYANTQIMTGQVIAGISSSASILYYNDKIIYPDNTSIDVNLHILTPPQAGNGTKNYATQAGVGLCAYQTTKQKAEAAKVFAEWFTKEDRNLDFVASTGYMPVLNDSFDQIDHYDKFQSDAYKTLYTTLTQTKNTCALLPEPNMSGYWNKVYALYDHIRTLQKTLAEKLENGTTIETITNEIIEYFSLSN